MWPDIEWQRFRACSTKVSCLLVVSDTQEHREGVAGHSFSISGDVGGQANSAQTKEDRLTLG